MGNITIVGLGPGPFGCLTLETWDLIRQAPKLLLRTAIQTPFRRADRCVYTSYHPDFGYYIHSIILIGICQV